jgi:hypothetical protein
MAEPFDATWITGIGSAAVSIVVDKVDNQAVVTLNGQVLRVLEGPKNFQSYEENITNELRNDRPNVLVVTVANYSAKKESFNPANLSGKLNVGGDEINLSVTSGNASRPQGIFAQQVVILER